MGESLSRILKCINIDDISKSINCLYRHCIYKIFFYATNDVFMFVAQKTTSLQITYPCDVLDWLGLDFVFDSLYLESAYKTIIIC